MESAKRTRYSTTAPHARDILYSEGQSQSTAHDKSNGVSSTVDDLGI